ATLARAMYDNRSSYDSELDFKKGAILTVLGPAACGPGWLVALQLQGQEWHRAWQPPATHRSAGGSREAPPAAKAVSGPELPPRNSAELQHQRGSSWDFYDTPDSLVRLSGPQDASAAAAAAMAARATAASRRSSGISTSSATSAAAPATAPTPAPPLPRQSAASSPAATSGGGKS
uniref:SH3 domain-containing protein n=1 Tax=Macrostomum lignano TaxID=282301 RepID=A0A1I8FBU0_9PLAT